jgi:hypothetical protein
VKVIGREGGPAPAHSWSCPINDPLADLGCTTQITSKEGGGGSASRLCPSPFDPDRPPAPTCTGRTGIDNRTFWECPVTDPAKPPVERGCLPANRGAIWQCGGSPFDASKPPAAGCVALGLEWVCPTDTAKPPAPNCSKAGTHWACPATLDPKSKPAPDCTDDNGRWKCPAPDTKTPPAPNCTAAVPGPGWSCPPDPGPKPAENCTLADKGWLCPAKGGPGPEKPPVGPDQGGLTPEQIAQICTQVQGGCKDGKPTAEQQCAIAPTTCTNGVPKPPGGTDGRQAGTVTPEQEKQACAADPAACKDGKLTAEGQCKALPATCKDGRPIPTVPEGQVNPNRPAPGAGVDPDHENFICDRNPDMCKDGKLTPEGLCLAKPASCAEGKPTDEGGGARKEGPPAIVGPGTGDPGGEGAPPVPNGGGGAPPDPGPDAEKPCPGPDGPPDPRPKCKVLIDPPAPGEAEAGDGGGQGGTGGGGPGDGAGQSEPDNGGGAGDGGDQGDQGGEGRGEDGEG